MNVTLTLSENVCINIQTEFDDLFNNALTDIPVYLPFSQLICLRS